jgi:hypothetical protein
MRKEDVEVLPVVRDVKDYHLVGMIEQKRIRQALTSEIIQMEKMGNEEI